jgi:hypothetical protein
MRERDIVPEESPEPQAVLKTYPNVWKNWRMDTVERLDSMYDKDIEREVNL